MPIRFHFSRSRPLWVAVLVFGLLMGCLILKPITRIHAAGGADASAHFHATVTSSRTTYSTGVTAIYNAAYTIDAGTVQEGDYIIVSVPEDLVSQVDLAVSSQHFKSTESLGGGRYKLTFGPDAGTALSGSFSMYLTTQNTGTTSQTGTITVGGATAAITVSPSSSSGGTSGTFTDVIMKDVSSPQVTYGDYDYSEGYGDRAAQIGVLKASADGQHIKFRLYINDKAASISNVRVQDTLPDGMTFDPDNAPKVTYRDSGDAVTGYSLELSGNTLNFSCSQTFSTPIEIDYWVNVSDVTNAKYTNRADITYDEDGQTYADHRNYVLQGAGYSAANGEKSVDKTVISTDPSDQLVTYTVKFWNQNGFAAGAINLTDQLDAHVRFVSAMPNSNFSVTQDAGDPQKIHIKNIKAISGSQTEYVRFVVDMSDVPVGYTVANTVGGNTTKTTKLSAQITAEKTVDGQTPKSGETFSFLLKDSQGKTLQTVQNQGKSIAFSPIKYDTGDLGKTFTYTVEEGAVPAGYTKDESRYTVTVKLGTAADSQGRIPITQTITKNGQTVSKITFDNKGPKGSLKIDKHIAGALKAENLTDTQKKALTFKVAGPSGSADPKTYTFTYADMTDGSKTLENLDPGTYTLTEITGHLDGYTFTCQIDGKNQNAETVAIAAGKTETVTITDTYTDSAKLPKAGGAGVQKLLLGGELLMLIALGWTAARKQRE
ncbi:MAG: hypothetical protein ACI39G_02935 [Pseudoramibacter sp.]